MPAAAAADGTPLLMQFNTHDEFESNCSALLLPAACMACLQVTAAGLVSFLESSTGLLQLDVLAPESGPGSAAVNFEACFALAANCSKLKVCTYALFKFCGPFCVFWKAQVQQQSPLRPASHWQQTAASSRYAPNAWLVAVHVRRLACAVESSGNDHWSLQLHAACTSSSLKERSSVCDVCNWSRAMLWAAYALPRVTVCSSHYKTYLSAVHGLLLQVLRLGEELVSWGVANLLLCAPHMHCQLSHNNTYLRCTACCCRCCG
jgi:hypothetical protein